VHNTVPESRETRGVGLGERGCSLLAKHVKSFKKQGCPEQAYGKTADEE